ncbi:hypothetical protein [Natronincola ferrireducens]|uniref:Uncharacterized protein n=1 Tax=Natronincola ferrireducens TaxID=393762 RepID=A0A1G9IFQ4_9FIRM|nr:hypothetical protein [Natronincola ferrireducens]SDL24017.1 hypothetical protein SAMN05660472_02857 [Natronincola ferrireducens]
MEILKVLAFETSRVALGLYGLCLIYVISTCISKEIERLVRWIGIQKNKYSRS